jgi:hypothetical protein
MSQILACLIVFVLIGALSYTLDRRLGVKLYHWFYDMTHEKPLPDGEIRGFVYNRRARARFAAAVVLAVVVTIVSAIHVGDNPLISLVGFFLEVPLLMIGFYLGPSVDQLWGRRDRFFDKVDKLESGETSVGAEFKEVSQLVAGAVGSVLSTANEDKPEGETGPAAGDKAPHEASALPPKEEIDPHQLMNNYLRRE